MGQPPAAAPLAQAWVLAPGETPLQALQQLLPSVHPAAEAVGEVAPVARLVRKSTKKPGEIPKARIRVANPAGVPAGGVAAGAAQSKTPAIRAKALPQKARTGPGAVAVAAEVGGAARSRRRVRVGKRKDLQSRAVGAHAHGPGPNPKTPRRNRPRKNRARKNRARRVVVASQGTGPYRMEKTRGGLRRKHVAGPAAKPRPLMEMVERRPPRKGKSLLRRNRKGPRPRRHASCASL